MLTSQRTAEEVAKTTQRPRLRKWSRRLLVAVVGLIVTATLFSLGYNAATSGRARLPADLRFVSADGIRTRYRTWGSSGPPIVLVHGAAESSDTWGRFADLLAAGHRVYALDLTGWGYSERRGPYDADREAAQLLGLLDALHLDRATLVGHSTGAAVVAAAALHAPARVSGLVFLDGTVWTPAPEPARRTSSASSRTPTGRPSCGSPSARTG
ncbi:alpha/beta fold hydrolase [Actinomadura rupiterrae]|uniref:alpha/beta fold hydrolase n=1 Tax=Actinomadura rupiterrae TaxID=559627 RepID=UPI0020A50C66|nr:alpha/beta hydrolase [Actinomadura rupiterrae]MCP2342719.1 pimeloyl-ACP methyl ester carboxylesterase [Actinomadura rupiterrae]